MNRNAWRYIVATLLSTLLVVILALVLDDPVPRAHPDRDETRLERVVDVQLPTL